MHQLLCTALLTLFAAVAAAQPVPRLELAGGVFTLSVPYLEYGSGSTRQAWSASLSSTTADGFVVNAGSVQSATLLGAAVSPPTVAAAGGGFRLTLPYLEFTSGGVTRAYAASLTSSDLAMFLVDAASVQEVALRTELAAPTAITLSEVNPQTVGGVSFGSSSRLQLSWTAPAGYAVDHYQITATEPLMNTRVSTTAAGTASAATLTPLKAGTTYAVVVKACADSACTRSGSAAAVSATTAVEVWQLQGSGNAVAGLSRPVPDGNARLSATRFGAGAGAATDTVQFYYGPMGVSGQSVASSGVVSAANPASYLAGFTSYATTTGLRSPTSATSGIKDIMTGQGVPLSAAMGSKVRLFFESNDADGKTRIYAVDSVDGYVGRDFNRGTPTTCSASSDYAAGGNCAATLVLGVEGDAVNPTPKVKAVRQNKITWPTLTDWRWDGAIGTFMVFTIDKINGCTTATHNHGYAMWNGNRFVPQLDAAGCPKAFKSAQAALPMHIGGQRYKMYFGDPSIATGKLAGGTLPFVGPKKLIYADGVSTGDVAIVEFEDWEGVGSARNVVFVWPNGEKLSDTAEGYIDDFHFLTPTGSLDIQVLYLSITDGVVVPFAATAVLLNP
ncbi:fibronectin type III domain-containing protein [Aquincola sp. S2]|uniref:Fibronectin type III domain-containing protein n=1 Tax=Pseudaquabacterium terrae TaxID=2732868 RepID=A0ABX2ETP9_9BURK|nr:fibronectin type III domain-containing protein [Aquabacterium terrae]NRF71846.1 fibronectin type III domain-containing protein [Aquabacterium terrae]